MDVVLANNLKTIWPGRWSARGSKIGLPVWVWDVCLRRVVREISPALWKQTGLQRRNRFCLVQYSWSGCSSHVEYEQDRLDSQVIWLMVVLRERGCYNSKDNKMYLNMKG